MHFSSKKLYFLVVLLYIKATLFLRVLYNVWALQCTALIVPHVKNDYRSEVGFWLLACLVGSGRHFIGSERRRRRREEGLSLFIASHKGVVSFRREIAFLLILASQYEYTTTKTRPKKTLTKTRISHMNC